MSTTFYLDYTYFGVGDDAGLAISDAQKALFVSTFIGSKDQIAATIGLNAPISGTYYINALLGDGIHNNLSMMHSTHTDHWLLRFVELSSVPVGNPLGGYISSGTDVVITSGITPFWRDLINSEQY